ncbi:MAG: acetate/propionate family kinase [Acidiferrobacterales bacterium]
MLVLVINCGSSSLKFQLIDAESRARRAWGNVERIGAVSSIATIQIEEGKKQRRGLTARDHDEAMKHVLDYLLKGEHPVISNTTDIEAVGHRVVHGGERLAESRLIDDDVIEAISDAFDLAPLHNPANLKGIQAARRALPNVPHVAVFDTAFHHSLPAHAYLYALPTRLYRRHKIRRYGFHGTSHYYVSRRLYELTEIEKSNSRVITCHLGNGASMAAIHNGDSVDTSMGFTPLSGLVMGTRCGDIDPSIVFHIVEKDELSLTEVHALLNRHSGILGLSGYASDMRDVLREAEAGDARCQETIEVFCYRAKCYLGQYIAALNGCDAVVFTAGIGENSPEIRARICEDLDNLGIRLDEAYNREAVEKETRISAADSDVQVWVIPTDEELVIAIDAMRIAQALVEP